MQAFLDTAPKSGSARRSHWVGGEPEKGALEYLIKPLEELGYIVATEQGLRPINWQDINAWKQATVSNISPHDCKALIDLSTAYIVEHQKALKPEAMSPFMGKTDHAALAARRRNRIT